MDGETTVGELASWMEELAPLTLSESWDNTGLLLGDRKGTVDKVMTCLTLSRDVVDEAIRFGAGFVVAHHPLPFKPLKTLTSDSEAGHLAWKLCRAGVAVYSPHTAWDSCAVGINAQLASLLELQDVTCLVPSPDLPGVGTGRIGTLPAAVTTAELANRLQEKLPDTRPRGVCGSDKLSRVAIGCGSAGGLLSEAKAAGCELFLTGEATYHTCLDAKAAGVSLLMIGHFASERFAMRELANKIASAFPDLEVWDSKNESDPVRNL